jgi:hypothetical protein
MECSESSVIFTANSGNGRGQERVSTFAMSTPGSDHFRNR